jgi:hypothetical protein
VSLADVLRLALPTNVRILSGHDRLSRPVRWARQIGTRPAQVVELGADEVFVVPPDTPHGFRNIGEVPLLVVSAHERGDMQQEWLDRDPA